MGWASPLSSSSHCLKELTGISNLNVPTPHLKSEAVHVWHFFFFFELTLKKKAYAAVDKIIILKLAIYLLEKKKCFCFFCYWEGLPLPSG